MAVADYVDGNGDAPRELLYAFRTEKWGPPVAGGWLEWEAGLISKMTHCLNVYHSLKAMQDCLNSGGNLAKFADANLDMWKIITSITKMRKNSGN